MSAPADEADEAVAAFAADDPDLAKLLPTLDEEDLEALKAADEWVYECVVLSRVLHFKALRIAQILNISH
ncbi:Uu.00g102120.m01.CDS01 [Anthostomella pinea]|uniref:Uu.00g102120.m01.CDS01 n=1 Tax=Anthostomella pinea TaxID=933095 RepID=A0AAI8YFH5_9PEZI|nr:Uu.00g102120.m01.CDS01 [Anthostomella pinea]